MTDITVPVNTRTSEVYLLLAAAFRGKDDAVRGEGKLTVVRDVDRFRVRLTYADGSAEECLPVHVGCHRDEAFCDRLLESIVGAVVEATQTLEHGSPEQVEVEFLFSESQEASVGTNSRYLLKDGTTAWYAYPWEDVVRPTCPL